MTQTSSDTHSQPLSVALPWRLVLAIAAGLLLTAGYALHPLWWAPWLAPIPLIAAASGSTGNARVAGIVAGAIATVSVLGYYFGMAGGWIGVTIILGLRTLSWHFAAVMTERAMRSLPPILAVFVLPALIAGLEVITLMVSVHGAAGSLAYSQMAMPGVIQVASLGGVPAVVFIILLPGSLAGFYIARGWRQAGIIPAAAVLALVVATGGYANFRLAAPEPARHVTATLIATDRFKWIPGDWQAVWAAYSPSVASSAQSGGLVVLPEKIALLDLAEAEGAARDISAVAKASGATIVTGIEVRDGKIYHNRSVVARPDGSVVWYTKQRLGPGFEDRDVPGKAPLFVEVAGAPLGVAICKDMHIPSIGQEYAGKTGIMAVSAWDFGEDGWMGARMTAMRGVEGGYAIARSARWGLVGAYDSRGRVIAEQASSKGMTVVTVAVPSERSDTIYNLIGNLFGYLCVLFTIAVRGWFIFKRT